MNNIKTAKQQEIVSNLVDQFGIDGERILFINERDPNKPWLPAEILEQIALQIDGYRSSTVEHDKFIPETSQIVWRATVTDALDRVFVRSGVAGTNEEIFIKEENGVRTVEFDGDYLAQGRALGAALTAAGFNPVKAVKMVNFADEAAAEKLPVEQYSVETEAIQRKKDLGQIHLLAKEKGLIVNKNDTEYRKWLKSKFGVITAAILAESERAQVINKLRFFEEEEYSNIPENLREEAMMA